MKFILAALFAGVMATTAVGCTSAQLASDQSLAEMSPESRVKYYKGLEYAEQGTEAALEGIRGAKELYENTYDTETGLPLEPETPEEPTE